MLEIIIIVVGSLIFLALLYLIFGFKQENNTPLLDELRRDRELRHRESESLRRELRDTSESLQQQFFRINKTVDTKLSESSKQLNERLDKSSAVIGGLQKELGKMGQIGAKIEHLDRILRAPKGRGTMGEEGLEEILRTVFPPALWERQFSLSGVGIVDAVVKTSAGLIPIDAKFPLPAFESLVKAETDEDRIRHQKEFAKAVKNRINEVAKYIVPDLKTTDFAILYLPNENIYYEAVIRNNQLHDYARQKQVLITGPNTMVYVLQVLFQAYQSQQFALRANEALAQLSGVRVQSEKLGASIQVLSKHIVNAHSKMTEVEKDNNLLLHKIEQVVQLPEG